MARENKKGGKIVLVSSTLGYMSFIGWASYSPAKHALRGMSITILFGILILTCNVRTCGHTSVGDDVVRC